MIPLAEYKRKAIEFMADKLFTDTGEDGDVLERTLTKTEFQDVVSMYATLEISSEFVKDLFVWVDRDKNKQLDRDEFVRFLERIGQLDVSFQFHVKSGIV